MIDPASREAVGELPLGDPGLASEPGQGSEPGSQPEAALSRRPGFAHASEAEMSRILDFYGVRWRYEPTTFPILWNIDGDVVESFSPDFYLPEFDLYLEMTTLKQSLVRKKNRKLRRLRELYPDIRIKLFYARDFRAMMLKYGRLGLAESLSGASGQLGGVPMLVPAHAATVVADARAAAGGAAEADDASDSIAALVATAAGRRRTMRRSDRAGATRAERAAVAKGEGDSA